MNPNFTDYLFTIFHIFKVAMFKFKVKHFEESTIRRTCLIQLNELFIFFFHVKSKLHQTYKEKYLECILLDNGQILENRVTLLACTFRSYSYFSSIAVVINY